MRRLLVVLGLSVSGVLSASLFSAPLFAQVSDSERSAARQLFTEGNELQKAEKYDAALDKFERAQRVFSAPTNLLHIAQCQDKLGKIVEATETYRTVIRTPLPAGAPGAFQQAVEQAKTELAQVEPRVPRVKIDVTPANAASLEVRLNGQPINAALIGEPLPLDPGTHRIVVFAPGYASNEQSVTLKERDAKTLTFTLKATGGIAYGPGIPPPPPPVSGPSGDTARPSDGTTRPPPPPDTWVAPPKPAERSILLGARFGVDIPSGNFTGETDDKITNAAAMGGAAGVEAGIRFAKNFYGGLVYEFASFGRGDKLGGPSGAAVTASTTSNLFGVSLAYISNPHGVGFYGEVGVGYRILSQTTQATLGNVSLESAPTYTGSELLLGAGLFIKAGTSVRILPKATFGLGSFSKQSGKCDPALPIACVSGGSNPDDSRSIPNSSAHAFIFLGVGGFYNIDLH
jgi:hypothetical protein